MRFKAAFHTDWESLVLGAGASWGTDECIEIRFLFWGLLIWCEE